MQMMYETIYKALVEAGLEAAFSPQDYLNFFCLGNREVTSMYDNVGVTGAPPPANSPQVCYYHPLFSCCTLSNYIFLLPYHISFMNVIM